MEFIKKDTLVVRQLKEQQSSSIIIKPDAYLEPIAMGEVLAVGRGTKEKPPNILPGYVVSYNDRSVYVEHLNINGEDLVTLNFGDILTFIKN